MLPGCLGLTTTTEGMHLPSPCQWGAGFLYAIKTAAVSKARNASCGETEQQTYSCYPPIATVVGSPPGLGNPGA